MTLYVVNSATVPHAFNYSTNAVVSIGSDDFLTLNKAVYLKTERGIGNSEAWVALDSENITELITLLQYAQILISNADNENENESRSQDD